MRGKYSKQKMVLGTHTSEGEQNYLMLAEVRPWPSPEMALEVGAAYTQPDANCCHSQLALPIALSTRT